MPPLPADATSARQLGAETSLAFAIEAARTSAQDGSSAPPESAKLFTGALAALIREALHPEEGDPAFQALVLRAGDAQVDEHARLSTQSLADRRAVRSALDAIAHPGKLRQEPEGALREALAQLHALAADDAWTALREGARALLAQELEDSMRSSLELVLHHPGLQRLVRSSHLHGTAAVQRYLRLCERRGPAAGSHAAAAQGRAAARVGDDAEQATVQAFREIARLLDAAAPGQPPLRVVRSLRTPRGFPGAADKAKDEWDAAIVQPGSAHGAQILLLAEVKAAPAAATPDFGRLLRGLERLALANAGEAYDFASADGEVRVAGASLQQLQPAELALPPHVIYCSCAGPEAQPQVLSAATKGVLLAQPACLAHAQALVRGATPADDLLLPVWHALPQAPHLRSALHQHATASAVREAMLHPQDLLAAVRTAVTRR